MSDYIERSVIERLLTIAAAGDGDKKRRTWAKAICVLHDAPTADVVEARRGRWEISTTHGFLMCSACRDCYIDEDFLDGKKWNFCPECGAKMDGGDDDATD